MNDPERFERFTGNVQITALSLREGFEFVQKNPLQEVTRSIGKYKLGRRALFTGIALVTAFGGFVDTRASADSPTIEQMVFTSTPINTGPLQPTVTPKHRLFLPFLARKVDQHGQLPCNMPPPDPDKPIQAQDIAASMCQD